MSKTVLIVEDEVLVAMDLEDIVNGAGHTVIGIAPDRSSVSALVQVPEIALVDLNLRDGATGAEIARRLSSTGVTTVIFITANPAQIGEPPEGSLGYVQKPFSPEAIVSALELAATGLGGSLPQGLHLFSGR